MPETENALNFVRTWILEALDAGLVRERTSKSVRGIRRTQSGP